MTKELTTEAPPSSSVQAPVEAKAPESPLRDPIGGPTYDALWMERDAALAEATNNLQVANENAYAAHQYADERDAARAQVATLSAALSKTRPYLDAVERALVDAALAEVTP